MTEYFVYILECNDGTLYTGKTININKRIRAHNGEIKGGAKYTRNKRPVKLVYSENYKTNRETALRELELKKLTRMEKLKLINK